MSQLSQDLRVAARGLLRQPTLALTIVVTLALGIGANTAIFSVVDSVLLSPPPFQEPDRVVVTWSAHEKYAKVFGFNDLPLSTAVFYDFQEDSRSFESLALLQSGRLTMTGQGPPEQLGVVRVTGDFFKVLGTSAAVGRTLQPEDDVPGNPAAVVLSDNYWKRRFGGDPGIVGQKVTLDSKPMTVVGVMPPRFAFPRGGSEVNPAYSFAIDPDAWVPFALTIEEQQDRANRFSFGIARLRPGVSLAQGQADLQSLCERYGELHPKSDKGWGARLVPISEQMSGHLRSTVLMIWAAVGFVLLIACANVTSLLLTRAATRQKEIAMRTAIGAGYRRLVTQLLTEAGLLAVLGGVLGAALAYACLRLFAAYVPTGAVGAATYTLDGRALAFTAVLCIATTILASLIPALLMMRPDLSSVLREGAREGHGTSGSRLTQRLLVVTEVALAVVLLIGAGLLLRSFMQLLDTDSGFDEKGVLSFRIDLPYTTTIEERVTFFHRVIDEVRTLAGVEASAVISELPLSGSEQLVSLNFEGRPMPEEGEKWTAGFHSTTPEYFQTMGIPLLAGRGLEITDDEQAPKVAVIDEAMAATYWPGEEALGRRFRTSTDEMAPWITVIGIVGNVRHSSMEEDPKSTIYIPLAQAPKPLTPYYAWIIARTSAAAESLATEARLAVQRVDSTQAVTELRTLEKLIADSMGTRRFTLLLLVFFAALALILAVVGIYGLTSYSVTHRRREMGLRMALGARPNEVLWMVLKGAGVLAALGVLVGVGAALALTRLVSSQLYGVGEVDLLTFTGVALGLLLVALVAAFLPARRATRVSPTVTLQTQ